MEVKHSEKLSTNERALGFTKFGVPQLVCIEVKAFITPAGERIPAQALEVVSTPRRKAIVTLAITEENMNWLVKAVEVDWPAVKTRKRRIPEVDFDGRPQLHPRLRYKCDSAGNLQIYGRYKNQRDESWRTVVRTVRPLTQAVTGECSEDALRACESEVLNAIADGQSND